VKPWGCYACGAIVTAEEMPRGWGYSIDPPVCLCPEHFEGYIQHRIREAERDIAWCRALFAEAQARPVAPRDIGDVMMEGFT